MLYLETPIGVGFSYSKDTSSYEGVSDKITGKCIKFWFLITLVREGTSFSCVLFLLFLTNIQVNLLNFYLSFVNLEVSFFLYMNFLFGLTRNILY